MQVKKRIKLERLWWALVCCLSILCGSIKLARANILAKEAGGDLALGADFNDYAPLGNRQPVILIHGWNSDSSKWDSFAKYFYTSNALKSDFKLYRFSYDWSQHIQDNGETLYRVLKSQRWYSSHRIYIVAHSMGGLVARSALENHADLATKLGVLIMLDTPNHGSPLANTAWIQNSSGLQRTDIGQKAIANTLHLNNDGGHDLGWDNSDGQMPSKVWHGSGNIPMADRFIATLNSKPISPALSSKYIVFGSYILYDPNPTISFHDNEEEISHMALVDGFHDTKGKWVPNYAANDGVVPLQSSLFLEDGYIPATISWPSLLKRKKIVRKPDSDILAHSHHVGQIEIFSGIYHSDLPNNLSVQKRIKDLLLANAPVQSINLSSPNTPTSNNNQQLPHPLVLSQQGTKKIVMAPVSDFAYWAGANLQLNRGVISIINGTNSIRLNSNSTSAVINGNPATMSVPAQDYQGILYAPVGDLADGVGGHADWNNANHGINMTLGTKHAFWPLSDTIISGAAAAPAPQLLAQSPSSNQAPSTNSISATRLATQGTLKPASGVKVNAVGYSNAYKPDKNITFQLNGKWDWFVARVAVPDDAAADEYDQIRGEFPNYQEAFTRFPISSFKDPLYMRVHVAGEMQFILRSLGSIVLINPRFISEPVNTNANPLKAEDLLYHSAMHPVPGAKVNGVAYRDAYLMDRVTLFNLDRKWDWFDADVAIPDSDSRDGGYDELRGQFPNYKEAFTRFTVNRFNPPIHLHLHVADQMKLTLLDMGNIVLINPHFSRDP